MPVSSYELSSALCEVSTYPSRWPQMGKIRQHLAFLDCNQLDLSSLVALKLRHEESIKVCCRRSRIRCAAASAFSKQASDAHSCQVSATKPTGEGAKRPDMCYIQRRWHFCVTRLPIMTPRISSLHSGIEPDLTLIAKSANLKLSC